MELTGCQGRDKTPTLTEKTCPQCGAPIEIFSTDVDAVCENCGYKIYNDTVDCVQWCKYAKLCVGDETYRHMMEIVENSEKLKSGKRPQEASASAQA